MGASPKKLTIVNFLAVLFNGSTGKCVTEQEVVYVAFADPGTGKGTGKATLVFLEVVIRPEIQDVPGLKKAIINTFKRNSLEFVIEKIVFLHQTVLQWIAENILG